LPWRAAFSVTGSVWGSKNGFVRALPASVPAPSTSTVSMEPSPQSIANLRSPAGYTRLHPGVVISAVKRRALTSTMLSEVAGVKLKTARKRSSSDRADVATPDLCSARLGGMFTSVTGLSDTAS
jgi:hypothetical protein